jgi:GNAT superfamily N-acetyltransferase
LTVVRRIRPGDGQLLRSLRLRALSDAPEAFGQTVEDAAARPPDEWDAAARAAAEGERRAWLVAEDDGGRSIGLVLGRRRPPDTLMVFSMWVDPTVRRGGVGRALVDAISEWGASWGARRLVLWVYAGNEPAIRFYRSLGLEVEPEGDDAVSGAGYGALAMSRAIAPAE